MKRCVLMFPVMFPVMLTMAGVFGAFGAGILALVGLVTLGGCNLGLDPDGLVRELRVLDARQAQGTNLLPGAGNATTVADLADIDLNSGGIAFNTIHLSGLAPSIGGPGRRLPSVPSVTLEWYLCVAQKTLLDTGTIASACEQFPGLPPPVDQPIAPPPDQNPALLKLGSGPELDVSPTVLGQAAQALSDQLASALSATGSSSADGGTGTTTQTPPALDIELPIILHASINPDNVTPPPSDTLDNETAFTFARVTVVPKATSGTPPAAPVGLVNHNPALGVVTASLTSDKNGNPTNGVPLLPCPYGGPCQPFSVPRGQPVYLSATSVAGSVETYLPLDESGRGPIPEQLVYSWFSTDGQFTQERTGDAEPETEWQQDSGHYPAPSQVSLVDIWVIVQDGRDGNDYQHFQFQLH